MIVLRNVRVTFGRTIALDAVDLDIEPGVIGLYGPNASGKSTLLRVIGGLQRPRTGSVTIDSSPPGRSNPALRRIGYAGHSSGLYGKLTVTENFVLFARLFGAPPSAVPRVLAALGLEARGEARVDELSAGLVRRAAVARALLHDPDVLLLDEPYANLDDDASELVSAAVRAWHTPSKIALIATHGAKRVKGYAHAGIVLRRGHVASYRPSPAAKVP